MADPRAFISFDFDHNENEKNLFVGQGKKDSPSPFTVADWSSKSALPEKEWEAAIAVRIKQCNLVIVLVGKNMATATGVAKEIAFAQAAKVPVFGVYVEGADGTLTLPAGLPRNRTVVWSWDDIAKAIDQMMTEGKNKP